MRPTVILTLMVFLAVTPAVAQQPPLQAQLDAGVATVSRVMNGLTNQVAADARQIEAQQRHIEELQQQLAAANAKTSCPAAGERSE